MYPWHSQQDGLGVPGSHLHGEQWLKGHQMMKSTIMVHVWTCQWDWAGFISFLLILFSVLDLEKPFCFINPLFLPIMIVEIFKFHAWVQDHGNSVCGWGVCEWVVAVHFLPCQLHGCDEGGVVCFPSLVVEAICDVVHNRNDSGNAGRFLGEKQCCILVLLQKAVISTWVDDTYWYSQVRPSQDLRQ